MAADGELVHRVLEGDQDAFLVLHNRYRTRLISYVFKRVNNHEDAQDIVQETFIKVYQHLDELKQPKKLLNWMFRIAFQLAAAKRREHQKHLKYISHAGFLEGRKVLKEAAIIKYRFAAQEAENRDLEERLDRAISKLPKSEREALLRRKDGMSHKEISQELGITEAAVNSLLARAREKVRGIVLKMEDD